MSLSLLVPITSITYKTVTRISPMPSMADQALLLQPFIAKTTEETSNGTAEAFVSCSGILLRLFFVILVGSVSLWANHEASKGFSITIINDAKDSLSGKRFALFFESDDSAVRILLHISSFTETFLYEGVPIRLRKLVNHVTIHFHGEKSLGFEKFLVTSGTSHGEYVINLSSSLMEGNEFGEAIKGALERSMVRIWLWGENSGAPPGLVAGMVEYLVDVADVKRRRFDESGGEFVRTWKDKELESLAMSLAYCERNSEGFIGRLNHGMRVKWDDRTVDLALGGEREGACDSRNSMSREV